MRRISVAAVLVCAVVALVAWQAGAWTGRNPRRELDTVTKARAAALDEALTEQARTAAMLRLANLAIEADRQRAEAVRTLEMLRGKPGAIGENAGRYLQHIEKEIAKHD